jgi:hypothetical protein
MTLSRVTRCALLLVPLFVCAGRLHAQRGATPAALLQEANRCLTMVRATSRRRVRNERSERMDAALVGVPSDHGRTLLAGRPSRDVSRAS